MKEKIKKGHLRRTRKLLEPKLLQEFCQRDKYLGCVSRKILGTILEVDPIKTQMDQRIRKLMTMQKASHLRDDVDRLYVSRKEGGRRLAITEDSANASIQRFGVYIEKRGGRKTVKKKNSQRVTDYSHQKQY